MTGITFPHFEIYFTEVFDLSNDVCVSLLGMLLGLYASTTSEYTA